MMTPGMSSPRGYQQEAENSEEIAQRLRDDIDQTEEDNVLEEDSFDQVQHTNSSEELSKESSSQIDETLQNALVELKNHKDFQLLLTKYKGTYSLSRLTDNDTILLNFLIDSKCKVKRAMKALVKMMEWRNEFNVDQALEWRFPHVADMKREYPHFYHGRDKQGHPIYVERLGKMNIRRLLEYTTLDEFTSYHILHWEYVHRVLFPRASDASGKNITKLVTVVDLSGLGKSHFNSTSIEFLKRIAKIDQEYYPESSHKLYIVNVPWLFKAVWAIIKPWLNARGRDKIQIVRSNVSETLLEDIDGGELPEFLGGSSVEWGKGAEESMWWESCTSGLSSDAYICGDGMRNE